MKNKKIVIYIIFNILIVAFSTYYFFSKDDDINNEELIKYTAIIERNGAKNVEKSNMYCTLKNNKCIIKLPNIIDDEREVLGYNLDGSTNVKYNIGEEVNIKGDTIFYAVTYKEYKLHIDDTEIDYLEYNDKTCRVYNKEKNCTLEIPSFNKKGYEIKGYSLTKGSLTGTIFKEQKYILQKDMTIYPVFTTLSRGVMIDVDMVSKINKITIEAEKNCSIDVVKVYIDYLNRISRNAPYLLLGEKISFLSDKTFSDIWGAGFSGMNYGANKSRSIDLICSPNNYEIYYATMVHELAHSYDLYYSNYYDKFISHENDVQLVYNKYLNSENRPFRNYSYTNINEFFSDSYKYYYFKYIDPIYPYSTLEYKNDIKEVVEKYICIYNNKMKKEGCE